MGKARRRRILWAGLVAVFVVGCAGHSHQDQVLRPPASAESAVVGAMEEGNRLFAAHQWQAAKAQYEAAIRVQPSLAEAHYNLALALGQLGSPKEARHHFLEAANLAPGHKVIWDSPPLRPYGNPESESGSEAPEAGAGHSH